MSVTVPAPKPAPKPQPAKAAPAQPPKSRLGEVKRGLLLERKRFFFYGPEGVGKSTLAADAPKPIVLDADRGSGHLDVARYPFRDGDDGHIAESLGEIYGAIDDLLASPHDYESCVLDTADSIESMIWRAVCERAGVTKKGDKIETIEDFGFGKGYNVAADEWRKLLQRLDQLRLRRGMHIIFVGHSLVKTFKNPTGEDYDRYRPKLDDRALGLLREWCEVVGFVTFDDVAKRSGGSTRARGASTGLRLIHLEHNAAWDAKSRLPLPAQIDLPIEHPWAPFAAALDALYGATPDVLRAKLEVELVRLGDVFTRADGKETQAEGVRAAIVAASDDIATLSKYLIVLNQSQPKEIAP